MPAAWESGNKQHVSPAFPSSSSKKETTQNRLNRWLKSGQSFSGSERNDRGWEVSRTEGSSDAKVGSGRKSASAKPKVVILKAEREARAKEQAERRNKQRENPATEKQQNGESWIEEERNPRSNPKQPKSKWPWNRSEQRDDRDHRIRDNRRQEQNRSNIANQNRPQTNQGPHWFQGACSSSESWTECRICLVGSEERLNRLKLQKKAAQREQETEKNR